MVIPDRKISGRRREQQTKYWLLQLPACKFCWKYKLYLKIKILKNQSIFFFPLTASTLFLLVCVVSYFQDSISLAVTCLSTDITKLLCKGWWQTVLSFEKEREWGSSVLMKIIIIFKVGLCFIYLSSHRISLVRALLSWGQGLSYPTCICTILR